MFNFHRKMCDRPTSARDSLFIVQHMNLLLYTYGSLHNSKLSDKRIPVDKLAEMLIQKNNRLQKEKILKLKVSYFRG